MTHSERSTMMAWPTIICGVLLATIGTYGYLNAVPKADGSPPSPTALIPAAMGLILMLCGSLAFEQKRRKHVMHAAAMVGVLSFAFGFIPLIRQQAGGKELDLLAPSVLSGLLMSAVSAIFVALCVRSFVAARKARQAAAGAA